MLLSNLTTAISSSTAAALLSMKVKVIPHEATLGGLYPTNSRSGSCAPPFPPAQGDEVDVPALPLLLEAFVRGANIDPNSELDRRRQKSELHFLASVFANVSTVRVSLLYALFVNSKPVRIDTSGTPIPLDATAYRSLTFIWTGGVSSNKTSTLHGTQRCH